MNACFEPADVGDVLALPAGDARRRHGETCPRCASLLDAYRLFLSGEAPTGAPDGGDMERRLRARLDQALGVAGSASAGAAAPAPKAPPAGARRPGWRARLFHPAMRPAIALGGLAAVLAAALLLWGEDRPGIVLRGGGGDGSFEITAIERRGDQIEIRWPRVPGADGYRVRVYGTDLAARGERDAGADTVLRVPAVALTAGGAGEAGGAGDTLVARVEALVEGDVLRVSPPRTFTLE